MVPTARSVLRIGSDTLEVAAVGDHVLRLALDEGHIEVLLELVVLIAGVPARCVGGERRSVEDRRQVEARRLPVLDRTVDVEQVVVADRLVERTEPELGEVLPHLLREELHEVDDELRLAGERLRSTGFCVATPTGQVSRWQTRIMMQPSTTSAVVANPELLGARAAPR